MLKYVESIELDDKETSKSVSLGRMSDDARKLGHRGSQGVGRIRNKKDGYTKID